MNFDYIHQSTFELLNYIAQTGRMTIEIEAIRTETEKLLVNKKNVLSRSE